MDYGDYLLNRKVIDIDEYHCKQLEAQKILEGINHE